MELVKLWATRLDDYVIDLAWSPDGAQLAAASAAGALSFYEAQDGTLRHQLAAHEGGANCLAWQPLAKPVAAAPAGAHAPFSLLSSGGQEPRVKFWDASAGQHLATAEVGEKSGDWVEHLAWRPRHEAGTARASTDAAQTSSGAQAVAAGQPDRLLHEQVLAGDQIDGPPASGPQNKESPRLLAVAAGRTLCLLRADGSLHHRFPPAPKSIAALAWSPDGACLASAYFGGVQLWDPETLALQKELPYAGGILSLVWSPDGRWLVSGNHDPSVHLWQPAADLELQMSGYETRVSELAFDSSGRCLATGGSTDCCVWDCSGPGPEGRDPAMLDHGARLCALAFQNKASLLAAASRDGAVKLWSIGGGSGGRSRSTATPLRATVTMPAAATKLAWSPDDSLLAIGTSDGTLYTLKYRA